MAFTFEIAQIHKLSRAKVGVLDGKLLDGKVIFNSSAELIHNGQRFPMHVISVVLDSRMHRDDTVTLSVEQGDLLVSDQTAAPKRRRPRRRPGRGY
jgi:hypothetical protein